ncbi:focadhesin-like isoform X2 [Eurytemora carolleeae]|uniref:focadhesin-like isoform X2 n=1 Tax=Eurytemora carolleeae TaxID=1294199 RepID=UPI000C75A789|nr:focadhesin-like isoform X2 [Eurytemora carolleeae]|eukprot:XP_023336720.1 focadhesin-like isoform X2 [Eurytemora affinis]
MESLKSGMVAGKQGSVLQTANKIFNNILSKGTKNEAENEELKLIWQLIGSSQVECSQSCSYLLLKLVDLNYISPQPAIVHLLSLLSHGMSFEGIVPAVGKLLGKLVERSIESTGEYIPSYCISSNQHPFISILRSTPSTWNLVLEQCLILISHPVPGVQQHALVLLRPVLLYLFCDPNYHIHFAPIRAVLFKTILKLSEEKSEYFKFLNDLVSWIPFNDRTCISEFLEYFFSFFQLVQKRQENDLLQDQVLVLTSLMVYQSRFGLDFSPSLLLLRSFISSDLVQNWDPHALMFSIILDSAPLGTEGDLVEFCLELIRADKLSKLVAGVLVSSFLQCLSFDSNILDSTARKAEFIRVWEKKVWIDKSPVVFAKQPFFNEHVNKAIEISYSAVLLQKSDSIRLDWLSGLVKMEHKSLSDFLPLLASIFLSSTLAKEAGLALNLMLACVKALPSMAGDRSCISLILKLLGSFSAKPNLTPLRLKLLLQLWRKEPRCFQFLHKALEEPVVETVFMETQITRALVIKDILSTHGVEYGSDLLSIISSIVNQCSNQEVTVAATLALESIYLLCKESVIDIRTTLKVLAPKCSKDERPKVVEAYIKLLSLAPIFKVPGIDYSKFVSDSLCWLWRIVSTSSNPSIIYSAYLSISAYPLETIQLRMLPEYARQGVKLPSEYCSTPADAARKPEDVLPYVPGDCWSKLINLPGAKPDTTAPNPILKGVKALLRALIQAEITNLPRSVYHLSQAMQNSGAEPVNYNHLPVHSVLRGILNHVLVCKDLVHPSNTSTELELVGEVCLGLLGEEYGRPLPPLDWLSMDQFLDRSRLKAGFIQLISRQAEHSRSARIILERQLGSGLDSETESLYFQQLKHIPSSVLGTFISRCLPKALKQAETDTEVDGETVKENEATRRLKIYLSCMQDTLSKTDVAEGSVLVISSALEEIYEMFPSNLPAYQDYIDTLFLLRMKKVERLSSPAVWWQITPDKIYSAGSLRTKLALSDTTETPLTWLNELLEVAAKQPGDFSFLLRNLDSVLILARSKSNQACLTWLLELMGQVSSLLRKSGSENAAEFLIDVFILAVVVFTGTDAICIPREQLCMSRGVRQSQLPTALLRLCACAPGLTGQLSDWCMRLVKKNLNSNISDCMRACLPVFKYSANWTEAFMWGRVLLL